MYKGGRQGYDSEEEREFQDLKSDLTSSDESNNVSPDGKYKSPSLEYEDRKKVAQLVKSFSLDNIVNMSINDELKPLRLSRSSYKGKITRVLNGLEQAKSSSKLDEGFFKRQETSINQYIGKIDDIENQMADIYDRHEIALEESLRKKDLDDSYTHLMGV